VALKHQFSDRHVALVAVVPPVAVAVEEAAAFVENEAFEHSH
jgi:hypothetical protein